MHTTDKLHSQISLISQAKKYTSPPFIGLPFYPRIDSWTCFVRLVFIPFCFLPAMHAYALLVCYLCYYRRFWCCFVTVLFHFSEAETRTLLRYLFLPLVPFHPWKTHARLLWSTQPTRLHRTTYIDTHSYISQTNWSFRTHDTSHSLNWHLLAILPLPSLFLFFTFDALVFINWHRWLIIFLVRLPTGWRMEVTRDDGCLTHINTCMRNFHMLWYFFLTFFFIFFLTFFDCQWGHA